MYDLLARLACPICGGTRATTVLAVVDGPQGHDQTVRAQCIRCHLFWSLPVEWLGTFGLEDRVQHHMAVAEPISFDEILDLHLLLRDFEGPLTELLPR